MDLSLVFSRALVGLSAPLVEVEAHLSNGLPSFNIVGLPETEVKESRDRVRAAIIQSGFKFPTKKIIVNLAPAELPKESGRYDLPIAISILAASQQIKSDQLAQYEFAGELALSGLLRPIRGAMLMVQAAAKKNRAFILPQQNQQYAGLIKNATIFLATHLTEVALHLNQLNPIAAFQATENIALNYYENLPDLNEIKGQQTAKFALEIAAAGMHSLLMLGPPGSGKSMLANRISSILPPLTNDELLETAAIHSLMPPNQSKQPFYQRPFRSPHHSSSAIALVGGGSNPKPGEISLANNGVLFLDELAEFDRKVLEMLREPIESGIINISRAARQVSYPAKFQLIAAMNPCPCGYYGHVTHECRCTLEQIKRYRSKLSGPLLDRIDLIIEVPSLSMLEIISDHRQITDSKTIRQKVIKSREMQYYRQNKLNSQLNSKELDQIALITENAKLFLIKNLDKLNLSARSFHRILRLARTIADLETSIRVEKDHILKAIGFRRNLIS